MATMHVDCVVPARIFSTRFPSKPLAPIFGRAMILHTLDRAADAGCFHRILCATDSERIATVVREAGYETLLTEGEFFTGSDRVAFVAERENLEFVVNLQGDEPLASATLLRGIAHKLLSGADGWVTGAAELDDHAALSRDVVKIFLDSEGRVCDFSREVCSKEGAFVHRGIYGYSRAALKRFSSLPTSLRERKESLEQLRVFPEEKMIAVIDNEKSCSVDRPEHVAIVEELMRKAPEKYRKMEYVCST